MKCRHPATIESHSDGLLMNKECSWQGQRNGGSAVTAVVSAEDTSRGNLSYCLHLLPVLSKHFATFVVRLRLVDEVDTECMQYQTA